MMMIGRVLVTMLVVSTMAMAFLQNVQGGREMAMKEAPKYNSPQILNQNLGYKPKEEYDCDAYRYKYKDRDCYEYGNCDKSPYPDDEDGQYSWSAYKKPMPESKEVAGKFGVHPNSPRKAMGKQLHKHSNAYGFYE